MVAEFFRFHSENSCGFRKFDPVIINMGSLAVPSAVLGTGLVVG